MLFFLYLSQTNDGLSTEVFGAYGITVTLLLAAIGWLLKQNSNCATKNEKLSDRLLDEMVPKSYELMQTSRTLLETNTRLMAVLEEWARRGPHGPT